MEIFEVIIGAIALAIAVQAFNLQRKAIVKNGKITSLIYTAKLLQNRIDLLSKIIDDKKTQNIKYEEWAGLESTINKKLRPLKEKVDDEFLNLASKYDGVLYEKEK